MLSYFTIKPTGQMPEVTSPDFLNMDIIRQLATNSLNRTTRPSIIEGDLDAYNALTLTACLCQPDIWDVNIKF
jgi:hypothetical protein